MTARPRAILRLLGLSAFALSSFSASPARAADAPTAVVPRPAAVTIGSMHVERYGSGSPAMIFIPGLSCGSWVWDEAVKRYAGTHAVYLVTLDGFDGYPAPVGDPMDAADASLAQLISTQHLVRPIVIGHSLGGFLALRFGAEHSTLVRGIVAVDGLPILPPFAQLTPEQRATAADGITAKIRDSTHDQFAANQKTTLATMITSPADVDRASALAAKSDPKAVAAYANELFRADLRPELPKLTAPTLEIAPVPTTPTPYEGAAAQSASIETRAAYYKAFYASLLAGAPSTTVVTIPNAKHFVMIDQPDALFDAITSFVATLPA